MDLTGQYCTAPAAVICHTQGMTESSEENVESGSVDSQEEGAMGESTEYTSPADRSTNSPEMDISAWNAAVRNPRARMRCERG